MNIGRRSDFVKRLSKNIILEYKYDSVEEREKHIEYMESQGYECSGEGKKMDAERNYILFGQFFKCV